MNTDRKIRQSLSNRKEIGGSFQCIYRQSGQAAADNDCHSHQNPHLGLPSQYNHGHQYQEKDSFTPRAFGGPEVLVLLPCGWCKQHSRNAGDVSRRIEDFPADEPNLVKPTQQSKEYTHGQG